MLDEKSVFVAVFLKAELMTFFWIFIFMLLLLNHFELVDGKMGSYLRESGII